jgi:hypothetical protein
MIAGMREVLSVATVLALLPAAFGETALDAIKQLPKGQAARIARIEARDGTPNPDRWYILTQDPAADTGVREFVVSDGKIVASRTLSQFAESLTEKDMLGAAPLTIDSDQAAKLARDYAEANATVVMSMNYELKKEGTEPAWTISCLDDKGNKIGAVVVLAATGSVLSHDGFALEPQVDATPRPTPRAQPPGLEGEPTPEVVAQLTPATGRPAAVATTQHRHRPQQASPAGTQQPTKSGVGKALDSVGRTLHKLLPF